MSAHEIDPIDARIAELEAELAELRIAKRVNAKLGVVNGNGAKIPSTIPPADETAALLRVPYAKMTAVQIATVILRQRHNQPMHFRDISKQAVAMGFKARPNSDAEAVAEGFWGSLRKAPDQ